MPLRSLSPRLGALALAVALPAAQALSVGEAIEAAFAFDAQYRAAGFELESARQNLPLAKSQLLPQLSFSAGTANITGSRTFPNSAGQEVTTPLDYSAPQTSLSLRQTLFNAENLLRVKQAEALGQSAEATYRIRALELVDRVVTAYVQVLLARQGIDGAKVEIEALEGQLKRAEQRLQRGEGTRTDEAQTRAALEVSRFRLVDARDQVKVAAARLRRSTGKDASELRALDARFQPFPLVPASKQEWIALAVDRSPAIEARRQALEAARRAVQRGRAGHLPRLDLVGSIARSSNDSISSLNQTSRLTTVGVQLSLPLFSGGSVEAGVRQAEADRERAEQDLRSERENLEVEVERLYLLITSGSSRIEAQQNVVAANETAVLGMTRAIEAGMATTADLLDARNRLQIAQRDLAQARYEYVVARARLLALSGSPTQDIAADLDRLFTAPATLVTSSLS